MAILYGTAYPDPVVINVFYIGDKYKMLEHNTKYTTNCYINNSVVLNELPKFTFNDKKQFVTELEFRLIKLKKINKSKTNNSFFKKLLNGISKK